MSTVKDIHDYQVGDQLQGLTRPITIDRAKQYSIGLMSAGSGVRKDWQHNIHTDHEYARSQGLPAAIADGMHSTNWLQDLLTIHFGPDFAVNGALRTKYIKPTLLDVPLTPRAVVTKRVPGEAGAVRYELDVWIEDADGTKLTVGDAAVTATGDLSAFAK